MRFHSTFLEGVFRIELERQEDERGSFARSFCERDFRERGLEPVGVQSSVSYNRGRGIVRGLHYQAQPHPEAKLVSVTRGRIFDVALDLRRGSTTHCRWVGVELSAKTRDMLYVPPGCAHGFQTLEDDTEVFYQMSEFYHPELARGVRWNDPSFAIDWPLSAEAVLSKCDTELEDYRP